MWPIAIVADIEKAFLMIRVAEVDQDIDSVGEGLETGYFSVN